MKIRALRGICIGVNRHLEVGQTEDVDTATSTFLKSIGAVELVQDEPAPHAAESPKPTTGEKHSKKEKTT
jgi:hypothetical protein